MCHSNNSLELFRCLHLRDQSIARDLGCFSPIRIEKWQRHKQRSSNESFVRHGMQVTIVESSMRISFVNLRDLNRFFPVFDMCLSSQGAVVFIGKPRDIRLGVMVARDRRQIRCGCGIVDRRRWRWRHTKEISRVLKLRRALESLRGHVDQRKFSGHVNTGWGPTSNMSVMMMMMMIGLRRNRRGVIRIVTIFTRTIVRFVSHRVLLDDFRSIIRSSVDWIGSNN